MSFKELEYRISNIIERFSGTNKSRSDFLKELRDAAKEAGLCLVNMINEGTIEPPIQIPPWLSVILKTKSIGKKIIVFNPPEPIRSYWVKMNGGKLPTTDWDYVKPIDLQDSIEELCAMSSCEEKDRCYGLPPKEAFPNMYACIFYEAISWLKVKYGNKTDSISFPKVRVKLPDGSTGEFITDWTKSDDLNKAFYEPTVLDMALTCRNACSLLARVEAAGDKSNVGSGFQVNTETTRTHEQSEKHASISNESKSNEEDNKGPLEIDKAAWLTCSDIAKKAGVNQEVLRKRLERWRIKHPGSDGCKEDANPKSNEARFLYKVGAIYSILEKLYSKKTSAQSSGKRPPKQSFQP